MRRRRPIVLTSLSLITHPDPALQHTWRSTRFPYPDLPQDWQYILLSDGSGDRVGVRAVSPFYRVDTRGRTCVAVDLVVPKGESDGSAAFWRRFLRAYRFLPDEPVPWYKDALGRARSFNWKGIP